MVYGINITQHMPRAVDCGMLPYERQLISFRFIVPGASRFSRKTLDGDLFGF